MVESGTAQLGFVSLSVAKSQRYGRTTSYVVCAAVAVPGDRGICHCPAERDNGGGPSLSRLDSVVRYPNQAA